MTIDTASGTIPPFDFWRHRVSRTGSYKPARLWVGGSPGIQRGYCGIGARLNGFICTLTLLFSALPVLAQHIYVYPTAPIAVRGSYQSVTAVVTGVSNKTVVWKASGGTIVGTNPCVVNEPCTVALYATTAGTYHLTATSNANGSVSATSTITFTASPTPATTHPRLYITQSMLSGLQAKAATGSPMYTALHGPTGHGYTAAEYYTQLKSGTYINNRSEERRVGKEC